MEPLVGHLPVAIAKAGRMVLIAPTPIFVGMLIVSHPFYELVVPSWMGGAVVRLRNDAPARDATDVARSRTPQEDVGARTIPVRHPAIRKRLVVAPSFVVMGLLISALAPVVLGEGMIMSVAR